MLLNAVAIAPFTRAKSCPTMNSHAVIGQSLAEHRRVPFAQVGAGPGHRRDECDRHSPTAEVVRSYKSRRMPVAVDDENAFAAIRFSFKYLVDGQGLLVATVAPRPNRP